jgi:hypothetical protein
MLLSAKEDKKAKILKIAVQKNGLQSGQISKNLYSETKFHQMKQNLKSLKQNLNPVK